jgi:hypothetical protein
VRAIRLRFMHEFSVRHLSTLQSYPSFTTSDGASISGASIAGQAFPGNASFREWLQNSSRERHSEAHLMKWTFVAWAIVSVVAIIPINIFANFTLTSDPAAKAVAQRFILLVFTGIAVVVLGAAALVVRRSPDKFSIQREIVVTSGMWILNFVVNLACNFLLGNTYLIANPIINTTFLILALLYSMLSPVLELVRSRRTGRKRLSSISGISSSSASTSGKDSDNMSMDSAGGESGISLAPSASTAVSKAGRRDRDELRWVLTDKKACQELEKFAAEEYSVEVRSLLFLKFWALLFIFLVAAARTCLTASTCRTTAAISGTRPPSPGTGVGFGSQQSCFIRGSPLLPIGRPLPCPGGRHRLRDYFPRLRLAATLRRTNLGSWMWMGALAVFLVQL